jgi:hypothetical protein
MTMIEINVYAIKSLGLFAIQYNIDFARWKIRPQKDHLIKDRNFRRLRR